MSGYLPDLRAFSHAKRLQRPGNVSPMSSNLEKHLYLSVTGKPIAWSTIRIEHDRNNQPRCRILKHFHEAWRFDAALTFLRFPVAQVLGQKEVIPFNEALGVKSGKRRRLSRRLLIGL
ncbi:hypothetical protein VNO77_37720 [Canavalia gladiata]|uniref:Uncharacterized protein n=1 Tax=Canavalia gladiata TaxID=3824 RepID=A0AAN9PWU2_CANGL